VNEFLRVFRALGYGRLAVLGGTSLSIIAFFVFVAMRLTQPAMSLLFGGLSLEESSQIVTRLEAAKIPYRLGAEGQQIFIPESDVLRMRMQLAESGLPTGGSVGYEIFNQAETLGATSFVQNINLLRALEGELSRTIRSIDRIQTARVHLVIPKREVFSREKAEPSASIIIKTRSARLEPDQVRAIQNLVAAAVPDLRISRISVVDARGTLLAGGGDTRDAATAGGSATDARVALEERLKRAVESLLERSVGVGNVRAEVTADVDYDQITTSTEAFDPESQVVRSTQTISEQARSSDGPPPTVSVANNLPDAAAGTGGNATASNNQRTEEVVNYEITKTVKTQVREAGLVRRVSVAVLVNAITNVDAQGKRAVTPRAEEELKHLTALARSAVGYDAKRGDTVEVLSMPFAETEDVLAAAPESLGFLGFTKADLMRLIEVAALGLISVLAMIFVVRPVVARLAAVIRSLPVTPILPPSMGQPALAGPGGGGESPVAIIGEAQPLQIAKPAIDSMIDLAQVEGQVKASSMKKIGEIVDKHPEEAVAIIRNWLHEEVT
jgi:flagellar M-ring protein FliF